jgi:hypothetical protein
MSSNERDAERDAERLPVVGGLVGEVKVFQPMLIREISALGITVETAAPLQLNSLHEVRLTLGDRSVVDNGRVVHAHISRVHQEVVTYRVGMEFVDPSERTAQVIADFVGQLKTGDTEAG